MKKMYRFNTLLGIFFSFLLIFAVLLAESLGVRYAAKDYSAEILSTEELSVSAEQKKAVGDPTCLLILDSGNESSVKAFAMYQQIMEDMRVSYTTCDLAKGEVYSPDGYETVVTVTPDLSSIGYDLLNIVNWVKKGGHFMIGMPVEKSGSFAAIARYLGIVEMGDDFAKVSVFYPTKKFMIGGGRQFEISDPYASSMNVRIDSSSTLYAMSGKDLPIVWEKDAGEGRFVVCNFGYCEKAYRGIFSSAYSLLEDVCVYPVINASTFYLDDWPSPVPSGDGQYIQRDYHMSIQDFYSRVWWPDMLKISRTYDIPYTGVMIETYADQTYGMLKRNYNSADYIYYGNTLLRSGGELGYHGYNHQPLCGPDYVYEEDLGYKTWNSVTEMRFSLQELISFAGSLFKRDTLSVYVPPSNILSDEGRSLIGTYFNSQIRAIASVYLPGESAYDQEFSVAEDGIVETPRVVSGCIQDDYQKLAALSELNFHFVYSHFLHPDDLLDKDRGAALGWETLKQNYITYIKWMEEAAPALRHETGSGLAGAVQRFAAVGISKTMNGDMAEITVSNLVDEAYCFVRINGNTDTEKVEGAQLTHLTGNLYLMKVTEKNVTIG